MIQKRETTSQKQWLDQWDVTGSNGDPYVVSLKGDGTYACSCPRWKFHKAPKVDCKHISAVTGVVVSKPRNTAGGFTYLKNAAEAMKWQELGYGKWPEEKARKNRPVDVFFDKFFGPGRDLYDTKFSYDKMCEFAEAFAKESGGVTEAQESETVESGEFKITRKFRLVS